MTPGKLDLVKLTAADLRSLLESNETTSVDIISQCLDAVAANNHAGMHLNTLISTAPREHLLRVARKLDGERRAGRVRGPLHGLPICLKDNIITARKLGMETTGGAHAFKTAVAERSAVAVERLIAGGLIIFGKANLSEFCGLKAVPMMPGFSSVGKMTASPYVGNMEKDDFILGHSAPGGSSTGSAHSVAAGFCPLAIGTETCGSVVTPSTRAGVYALRVGIDKIPSDGVFRLSTTFDCLGAMAKSARDVADLVDVLFENTTTTNSATDASLRNLVRGDWYGLSTGFVDPKLWKFGPGMCREDPDIQKEMDDAYEAAISSIRKKGARIQYPVTVRPTEDCKYKEQSPFHLISFAQTKSLFDEFCSYFESTEVHSLAELVEWNKAHPHVAFPEEYPNQDELIKALENDTDAETVADATEAVRRLAKAECLDKVFDDYGIDVIVAPTDCSICIWSSAAGYPIAIMPYGVLKYNGRPFGVCAIAREEGSLVRFMSAWEASVPERPLPRLLMEKL